MRNTELGRVDPRRQNRPPGDRPTGRRHPARGNWPTMSVVGRLEQDLGKPVLTNNVASIWAGLRILGCHDRINGYGRLLSNSGADR